MDEGRRASGTVENVERGSQTSFQVNGVQSAIQGVRQPRHGEELPEKSAGTGGRGLIALTVGLCFE